MKERELVVIKHSISWSWVHFIFPLKPCKKVQFDFSEPDVKLLDLLSLFYLEGVLILMQVLLLRHFCKSFRTCFTALTWERPPNKTELHIHLKERELVVMKHSFSWVHFIFPNRGKMCSWIIPNLTQSFLSCYYLFFYFEVMLFQRLYNCTTIKIEGYFL